MCRIACNNDLERSTNTKMKQTDNFHLISARVLVLLTQKNRGKNAKCRNEKPRSITLHTEKCTSKSFVILNSWKKQHNPKKSVVSFKGKQMFLSAWNDHVFKRDKGAYISASRSCSNAEGLGWGLPTVTTITTAE